MNVANLQELWGDLDARTLFKEGSGNKQANYTSRIALETL